MSHAPCSIHGPRVVYDTDGRPHVCAKCKLVHDEAIATQKLWLKSIGADEDEAPEELARSGLAAIARRARGFERRRNNK